MRTWAVLAAVLAWPCAARADRPLAASVGMGAAFYPSSAVSAGPSLAVQASAGLTDQLSLVAAASTSRHAIDARHGGGALEVTEAGGGFSYLVDAAPVLPFLHAGVMAAYRDTGRSHAFGPWPYLGLELVLPVHPPFTVALNARYAVQLRSGLTEFGYAQLGLAVGLLSGVRPP